MFTHLDENDQPAMVDVGAKPVTLRTATARAVVTLPDTAAALLANGEIQTKKGPVFQTAVIAGIMGAKKTAELVPLCHPLALDDCKIAIALEGRDAIITCRVRTHAKTGVEMEALTGASTAALTIYDMCKAFSHEMVIREVRLVEKHGGKRDFSAGESDV
jgi:cyclic pyranopterin phosphate synthase